MDSTISVLVERGGTIESRHRVHAACVRGDRVTESAGDADFSTVMRSAAKPFQALPLALAAPDLTDEELAIACASHEALPEQLDAVRALLDRAGASEDDLECGVEAGSRLRHNCSGKHAGMILLAKRRAWPIPGYRLPDHPLQLEMLAVVAQAADAPPGEIPTATDGCGVVAFAFPIEAMARMFSRLVREELTGGERVVRAMRAYPGLIGGPNASETALMRAIPGAIAKRGAEGLLCGALADGTGFAVKVEDGANRAVLPAAAYLLGIDVLKETPILNSRGDAVGRIFPTS